MELDETEEDLIKYVARKIDKATSRVIWIRGIDGETVLCPLWKEIVVKTLIRKQILKGSPFDYVIEIKWQPQRSPMSRYTYATEQRMIAEALGILDQEERAALRRLFESEDELDYYGYLDDGEERIDLLPELAEKIYAKLSGKRYLIVFEHVKPPKQFVLTELMGLPTPNKYNGCWWLISTKSLAACKNNKSEPDFILDHCNIGPQNSSWTLLLRLGARNILSSLSLTSHRDYFAEDAVLDCLFYCFLFLAEDNRFYQYYLEGRLEDESIRCGIKGAELVRYWLEEGFITRLIDNTSRIIDETQRPQRKEDGHVEEEDKVINLFNTGKALLDKFMTWSLLRQVGKHSVIWPTDAMGGFCSGKKMRKSSFLADWLWLGPYTGPSYGDWEDKKYISLAERKWNIMKRSYQGPSLCPKLTTLILRGCSQMQDMPSNLFQDMPHLRVLDLSYTDLTFLPSSLSFLINLRLLSLRGCQNLTTLASSPSSSAVPNSPIHDLHGLRVLDVSYTKVESLPPTLHMPQLTHFFLDGCIALLEPPLFLESLTNLRVLRLTGSQITTFPESTFSCMLWLRVLDLSDNNHLISLPASLSKAKRLQELRIHGCEALKEMKAVGGAMLRYFSLSDNDSMESLPESLSEATGLEEIHLRDCRALRMIDTIGGNKLRIISLTNIDCLTSLPDSLSKVDYLEELHVKGCQSLKSIDAVGDAKLKVFCLSDNDHLVSLPESFRRAKNLEDIQLEDCRALEDIEALGDVKLKNFSLSNNDKLTSLPECFSRGEDLEKIHLGNCRALKEINMAGSAKLRSFFLYGSPIIRLSLRGCKNLETIELCDLEELEFLDLSFTRIKELPANIFGLPKLRRFVMLAAQQLRRFPWHDIHQLPDEFIFDQCQCEEEQSGQKIQRHGDDDNKARARISVEDPRFFCSLKEEASQRLIGNPLLEFHVTISPCEPRCKKIATTYQEVAEGSSSKFIQRGGKFPYTDLYAKCTDIKRETGHRPNRPLRRHLTMEGIDRFPKGRLPLLDFMDSVFVSDDRFLVNLSEISPMDNLKECLLSQCHNMEYFVVGSSRYQQTSLEILWVSGLGKLTTLLHQEVDGREIFSREFGNLKHVHLEQCPRLEKLFPSSNGLMPSLEKLTIKFCDSLREIIYTDGHSNDEAVYPRLHTIILFGLPKLVHFRKDPEARMPSLKVLQVRGCWRLRRIPLLGDRSHLVEVSGEQEWWDKLTWDHYGHENYLSFKDRCIRFRPKPHLATSKPTVRGRPRRKISKPHIRRQ